MNIQEQIEALTQELRPYPPEGTVWLFENEWVTPLMNKYELRAIQSNVNLREWMSHRRLLTLEKWAHRKLKRRLKRFKNVAFDVLQSHDYNHICEVTGEQ